MVGKSSVKMDLAIRLIPWYDFIATLFDLHQIHLYQTTKRWAAKLLNKNQIKRRLSKKVTFELLLCVIY